MRINRFSFTSFVLGFLLCTILLIFCIEDLDRDRRKMIRGYEAKIKEQSQLINDQATIIIDGKYSGNCDCGWYESYYYEHVGEDVYE